MVKDKRVAYKKKNGCKLSKLIPMMAIKKNVLNTIISLI